MKRLDMNYETGMDIDGESPTDQENPGAIEKLIFLAVFLIGILVRVLAIGNIPAGINQDEAYAGYEAYSILTTGKDSFGYHLPVYLMTWGSGMNALESYLMIPFIALFGLKTWVIRLPQMLVGIATLLAIYGSMKELFNQRVAGIAMFLLAISPWHIMMSRWGLESNLAPGMLCIAFFFFLKGMKKEPFYLLSALFYGLSLYAYATIWPLVPALLIGQILYAIIYKKCKLSKYTVGSAGILAVFSFPLLLFLMVNTGKMEEVNGFISIPKLLYFRGGELAPAEFKEHFKNFITMVITGQDGLITNAYEPHGFLYKLTIGFALVGIIALLYSIIRGLQEKREIPEFLLLLQFLSGLGLAGLLYVNINRINMIWIPMICLAAAGIYHSSRWLVKVRTPYLCLLAVIYGCLFFSFSKDYFTKYNEDSDYAFCTGFGEALAYAEALALDRDRIYISDEVSQARVLFYSQMSPEEYRNAVEYTNYPAAFLSVDHVGKYYFAFNPDDCDRQGIYILNRWYYDTSALQQNGFAKQEFGMYDVYFVR